MNGTTRLVLDVDAGFAVSVVEDCCASPNPAWHEFAITQILPAFRRVVASKDVS